MGISVAEDEKWQGCCKACCKECCVASVMVFGKKVDGKNSECAENCAVESDGPFCCAEEFDEYTHCPD